MKTKIRNARAKLIELLNGIKVKEDYPVKGCLSLSQHLGFQEGIGMFAKVQLEEQNPYFELNRYGKKIEYDLQIADSRFGGSSRYYFFSHGEDIGLVEKFTVDMGGSRYEFYYNGRNEENEHLGDDHFMAGTSKIFNISDYKGDYRPLIKTLELRLGRKVIDKKKLAK